jgi:hypothetical protein
MAQNSLYVETSILYLRRLILAKIGYSELQQVRDTGVA